MRRYGLILLAAALFSGAAARDWVDRWVVATDLPVLLAQTSVEARDRNGALLRAYTVADGLWRLRITPDRVDPGFIDMLIAYEDKRFWTHGGVDPLALMRAAGQSLWQGRVVSGGSTLTMQVARLMEDSGTGRIAGKLRQMRVAMALERRLSKSDILNLYLLHAPYGGNLEGIRAATLAYFCKEPARLSPAQAALLVALPQAPEARRPDRDPAAARAARDRVLLRMHRDGAIAPDTLAVAMAEPVPARKAAFPAIAPHVTDRARAAQPDAPRHDLTLDTALQEALERLATQVLRGKGERLSVAMIVADHQSGEILASVGSAGFTDKGHRQGFVDMTTARRSPGSTLKPLVYALAFDQGLAHPETLIDDRPVAFGPYAPQNFDGEFRGEIRVSEALRQSLNIPVVLLTDQLGPARLMNAMRRAGMDPALPGGKPGLAIALGGIGVSLEDLVTLFAGQANGGVARPLRWRKGADVTGARIVSRSAAWQVGHILSAMPPPPGAPLNRLAYKTGTSYGHRDAWAVGYDGRHVAGVWIGRPDGTPVPGAFGGDLAAPVLFEAFQRLKPALDPLPPPPPETLMVSTSALPQPLKRFRGRGAVFERAADAPKLAFPPDGARLLADDAGVTLKIRDGALPYSVLANGRVLATGLRAREVTLPFVEPGFSEFSVIDAKGRSDRVRIRID